MPNLYTAAGMSRATRRIAVLVAALGLGLGLFPGLLMAADCMVSSGCPMMRETGRSGHCAPESSFVSDCCAVDSQPADSSPASRLGVSTNAESATIKALPAAGLPEAFADASPRVAAKLHKIGLHTLFGVYLS